MAGLEVSQEESVIIMNVTTTTTPPNNSNQESTGSSSACSGAGAPDEDDLPPRSSSTTAVEFETSSSISVSNNNNNNNSTDILLPLVRTFFPDLRELSFVIVFFVTGHLLFAISHIWFFPRQRPIPYEYLEKSEEYVRDSSYNEAWEGQTISLVGLAVLVIFGAFGVQVALILKFGPKSDVHRSACIYGVAITLNNVATQAIKLYVGYLRPVFFDDCLPDDQYTACSDQYDNAKSSRTSFPSGHSSLAVCAFVILTMYLERTLGISSIQRIVVVSNVKHQEDEEEDPSILMEHDNSTNVDNESENIPQRDDEQGESILLQQQSATITRRIVPTTPPVVVGEGGGGNTQLIMTFTKDPFWYRINSILALIPIAVALFVASSRVVDNEHFPADIVGGAVLGAAIAIYTFRIWFPDPRYGPIIS